MLARQFIGPLCLLLAIAAVPATAQHATGSDVLGGEQAFQAQCASCHGRAGNQVANVDLGLGRFRRPYDDEELLAIVLRGIPGTAMPATPGMTREQALRIVAWLRSRAVAQDASAGGDAARGRALFDGKGECLACHRVAGSGSRLGPDLTRIGSLRTADQLARSLLEPDAEVQPVDRSYRVVTQRGERVSGRLLNQDAFSVQLLDDSERLRSFARTGLRSAEFIPSPMPSVRGRLEPTEVADLVRYLASLRGPVTP